MRVYLAEKASQAADLAQVLDSGYQREDGFISLLMLKLYSLLFLKLQELFYAE